MSAMRARLPSERRSSSFATGTMHTVSVPSRSATRVLNTRAGSMASASAASMPVVGPPALAHVAIDRGGRGAVALAPLLCTVDGGDRIVVVLERRDEPQP